MKSKIAALIVGIVLGSAGTGVAVSGGSTPNPVPRGYGVRFVGLPQLLCVNKRLSESAVGLKSGSLGVFCITNYDVNATDAYYLTLDWSWIKVFTPSGRLAFKAPMVTHR